MERFIQESGMVDIVCLSSPIRLLETYAVDVDVVFYTNNEPVLCLSAVKQITPSSMRDILDGMVLVRKKFYDMGYDKIFSITKETDTKGNKLARMIGFIPSVYYEDNVGTRYIKNEMSTEE